MPIKIKDATYKPPYENTGSTRTDFGTAEDREKFRKATEQERKDRLKELQRLKKECAQKGGYWDEETQKCYIGGLAEGQTITNLPVTDLTQPTPAPVAPVPMPPQGEYDPEKKGFTTDDDRFFPTVNPDFRPGLADTNITFNPDGTVTLKGADGKTLKLTRAEYAAYMGKPGLPITGKVKEAQELLSNKDIMVQKERAMRGELAGQVGEFGELGISPTALNYNEAATTGLINAIPRALGLAASGAGVGALGGGAAGSIIPGAGTAAGAGIGALIGGVGGFITGISGSMISNLRSQRTDTTKAQKRVLDEGKQNLNDWATLAATDPANRGVYIANFNQQLALIDQAYREMKLDTSRDVAKFETAIPDLAEFEAFYAAQGERDFLVTKMQNNILTPQDPDYIYQMQELVNRRL